MTGAAGVLSLRYFSGTVAALVSATMKKPPSGMMGLSPAASSASTKSCLWCGVCEGNWMRFPLSPTDRTIQPQPQQHTFIHTPTHAPLPLVLRDEPCVVGGKTLVGLLGLVQHVGHGLLQGRRDGELHPAN